MTRIPKYDRERVYKLLIWFVPIVFYLCFWVIDGAVWCADSASYVEMHDCREPLYPMLLALMRAVFHVGTDADPVNNISLSAVSFLQSILAGIAAASLSDCLRRTFKLGKKTSIVLMSIPLFVSLMERFAAGRGSMYANSILTEGITISIYMLAVRYLIEYAIEKTKYSYAMSCVVILTGIAARKQMIVLLCLFVIVICGSEGQIRSKIKLSVMTALGIAAVALLIDCTYNKIVRDVFIPHTEDNRFIATMAFYTAERDYVQYITPELKELYLEIYDACDENRWLMHDSPGGWYDSVGHFEDNYDHIQLDTMQLILEDRIDELNYCKLNDKLTKTEKMDVVRAEFNKSLLIHEIPQLLKVFANSFLTGLVDTVTKRSRFFSVVAELIYAVYALLIVYCVRLKSKGRASKEERGALVFSEIVVLSILGNVALVSAVIFCQPRYTVYNMPLFYMSMLLLIRVVIHGYREGKLKVDHV